METVGRGCSFKHRALIADWALTGRNRCRKLIRSSFGDPGTYSNKFWRPSGDSSFPEQRTCAFNVTSSLRAGTLQLGADNVHVPLVGQNNSPHGKFPEQKNSPKRKILRFGTSIKRLERIGSDLVAFDLTRDIQHGKPLRTPMRWKCCLKLTRISFGRPCVASAQQDAAVIVGVEVQL